MLAGDPVPSVLHGIFDAFPGPPGSLPSFELVPPGAQIRLHIVPLPAQVMLAGLEAVLVGRAEVFLVPPGSVGARREVAAPPVVFVIPGSILRHRILLG